MVEDKPSANEIKKVVAAADLARQSGYARASSTVVKGITDISAPIMRGDRAIVALTVPYIKTTYAQGPSRRWLTESKRLRPQLRPNRAGRQ